jgi:tetratricopeptide (TPR) repeat protein
VAERPAATAARQRLTEILLERDDKEGAAGLILNSPNPEIPEILLVAKLEEDLGKLEFAETLLERGIRGFPGSPELKNALAWFLQKYGGDLDEALALATGALQWAPDDPYYLDTRAVVRLRRGEPREALEDLDRALALPGGDLPAIRWHRARALGALGRRHEAEAEANGVLLRDDIPEDVMGEIAEWLAGR